MATSAVSAKRLSNGTFGEIWLDGEKIAECKAMQSKVSKSKDTVNLPGRLMTGTKITSMSGTGSLTLYHVDSGMAKRLAGESSGIFREFTLISKLADPNALGAERIALYGVSFDDLTLSDWKAAATTERTTPFTFSSWEFLDAIGVQ